jgi:hypothetical protein
VAVDIRNSVDGIERSVAVERQINEQLALVFRGAAGKAALDYLRSISIERVCGPFASDAELRHLEGMRFIVGVISQRIARHHKEQTTNVRSKPAARGAAQPDATSTAAG